MNFATLWIASITATCTCLGQDSFIQPVGLTQAPIEFELRNSGAIRTETGVIYRGDASVVTPLGRMVLAQSDLWFEYAPGTQQVQTVRGKAFVPTPLSGQEISIDEPVVADLGYDLGNNIQDLGVPLLEDRGYLFFKFDAGLTMRVGKPPSEDLAEENDPSFTISFPAGASSRIVVDPLDPMYYFAGGVTLPTKSKDTEEKEDSEEDGGFLKGSGSSQHGLFPFRPLVTWGIEDKAREFHGHRIETGTFPLFGLPVTVSGHLVTNIDPLATGELAVDPLGIGFGPVVQAGANGRFNLSLDFLKVTDLGEIMNLTVPLGKATAAVEIVNDRQLAYISGIGDSSTDLGLPTLLAAESELTAAALISSAPEESRLYMEGRYRLGASEFGKKIGIDTGDLLRVDGRLRADQTGLLVYGKSDAGSSLGPIATTGELAVEMQIPAQQPDNSYLQVSGKFRFAGAGTDGVARIDPNGVAVGGKLTGTTLDMSLQAGITSAVKSPAMVYGNLSVPAALQPDFQGEIQRFAASVRADLDSKLSAYEKATEQFEVELSLRGMRTIVPSVTDAVIREIDRTIPAQINSRWPRTETLFGTIEAPGKNTAIRYASERAEPYRDRLRNLKRQMQAGDSDAARAALERAIREILDNPRIVVTYRVPVVNRTITIVDETYVSSSLRSQLNAALAGVRALPEASERKMRASEAWERAPKREILMKTADAIEKGISSAIPRVEAIGFRFPLGQPEWVLQAQVAQGGSRSPVSVRIAPDNIGSIGASIGRALAEVL